jgi:hypothetical protein
LCPADHRVEPYLSNVISPDYSNSHCSFEMSFQIWCGSWCRAEVPRISSIRLFRIRRCLEAVAKKIPCPGGGVPCFHDSMSRRWSHAASLCQTLPVVSSQSFRLSGHFRLRCAKPLLHGPLEIVFHDLAGYIFCLHASIYMGVEGVGHDGQGCGISHTPHILR